MRYFLVLLAFFTANSLAETRWVTDDLSIMMRSGQSNKHKILRPLVSGTELKVISEDEATGYSLINTTAGQEGFVLTRFLVDEPVAKAKLVDALAQIEQLSLATEPAQLQLSQALETLAKLEQELTTTKAKNQTLLTELKHIKSISADTININEQLRVVLERNQILDNELNMERAENERLTDSSNKDWFINGALAVLLGAIIAVLVPKLRRPKRHSEWV